MKKLNKKGIMLKFLTSLLIAIIVFLPACMVSSSFFRTSTQALENFESFVEDIQEFAETKPIGYKGSSLLILDEETAIIYFDNKNEGSSDMGLIVEYEVSDGESGSHTSYDYIDIKRPDQCGQEEKTCICLFRDVVENSEGASKTITGNIVECYELDYHLEPEACGWGEKGYALTGYTCTNGFLIERDFIKEFSSGYYENERRQTVYLYKLSNAIRLSGG